VGTVLSIIQLATQEPHSIAAHKCSKTHTGARLSTLVMKGKQQISDTTVNTLNSHYPITLWSMIRKAERRKPEMMVAQEVLK